MVVDSFEGTRGLDVAALRALLAGDRPEQRVWAAWALALRVGSAMPHLVDHVGKEPSAGVRRLLLPVLAGHGEVDILVALARHDPAVEVRGSAWQLVARFIVAGRVDRAALLDSYAVEGPAVRAAMLGAVTSVEDLPLVVEALGIGTDDGQLEAFEAALRIATPESQRIALDWLSHHAAGWLRLSAMPPVALVALLAPTSPALRQQAIMQLGNVPLATLSPLVHRGDERAFAACRDRSDFDAAPAELLARGVLSGFAVEFLERLEDRVTQLDAGTVVELRGYVSHRLAEIAAGRYLRDEQPGVRWPARHHYHKLLVQLERFG
ncbi:MAG: hypothetical protein ABIY55_05155 [Kofleriaceae bacterium]